MIVVTSVLSYQSYFSARNNNTHFLQTLAFGDLRIRRNVPLIFRAGELGFPSCPGKLSVADAHEILAFLIFPKNSGEGTLTVNPGLTVSHPLHSFRAKPKKGNARQS